MEMLNVGCGTRYHQDWVNMDMVSTGEGVIAANLLKGIPCADNRFDVVYHSHVLEHFTRAGGEDFTRECVRVLKPGGILRISTPDLENIVREYLKNMELAIQGDKEADSRYEWNLLEMYDQAIRNASQGQMGAILKQQNLPGEAYIMERIGYEGELLRKGVASGGNPRESKQPGVIQKLMDGNVWRNKLARVLLGSDGFRRYELGKFREGGEIHYMMYDRHSITKLLHKLGMTDVKVLDAATSDIPKWNEFGLDQQDGKDYKPFSLIVEARKK